MYFHHTQVTLLGISGNIIPILVLQSSFFFLMFSFITKVNVLLNSFPASTFQPTTSLVWNSHSVLYKVLTAWSCLTLCDPVDCSPPGFSLYEVLQLRILEWVAISFSRESSQPKDQTWVSCIAGRFFTILCKSIPKSYQFVH